jgi:hypothetical protein
MGSVNYGIFSDKYRCGNIGTVIASDGYRSEKEKITVSLTPLRFKVKLPTSDLTACQLYGFFDSPIMFIKVL